MHLHSPTSPASGFSPALTCRAKAKQKLIRLTAAMMTLTLALPIAAGLYGSYSEDGRGGPEFGAAIDSPEFSLSALAMTDDGFMMKSGSQTADVSRSEFKQAFAYTVEESDTLQSIADRFNITADTILWENNLANATDIVVGKKLSILPVSGIAHTVAGGEDLKTLAERYGIKQDSILAQNGLTHGDLVAGSRIIIPGGQKIISIESPAEARKATIAKSNYKKRGNDSALNQAIAYNSGVIGGPGKGTGKASKWMIKPTTGNITTYFGGRSNHWGVDIADRSSPAVNAAADGTIIASGCGWNGGYGCMIVIDHGDKVQTLYGHMKDLKVKEGDSVKQGDQIGTMSNTGRTYGKTGIHLHFEVIDNGRKRNPVAYY